MWLKHKCFINVEWHGYERLGGGFVPLQVPLTRNARNADWKTAKIGNVTPWICRGFHRSAKIPPSVWEILTRYNKRRQSAPTEPRREAEAKGLGNPDPRAVKQSRRHAADTPGGRRGRLQGSLGERGERDGAREEKEELVRARGNYLLHQWNKRFDDLAWKPRLELRGIKRRRLMKRNMERFTLKPQLMKGFQKAKQLRRYTGESHWTRLNVSVHCCVSWVMESFG